GLLEGVWRRRFIQETTAGERPVSVPELLAADEVVIGNSVIGRVRVDAIEVEASAGLGLHIQAHQADQPAGQ
ncbi:MAG TPA: hypothetical protein PK360_18495, partial [bacterium]|nr:hypothetical protein [bacterium]